MNFVQFLQKFTLINRIQNKQHSDGAIAIVALVLCMIWVCVRCVCVFVCDVFPLRVMFVATVAYFMSILSFDSVLR